MLRKKIKDQLGPCFLLLWQRAILLLRGLHFPQFLLPLVKHCPKLFHGKLQGETVRKFKTEKQSRIMLSFLPQSFLFCKFIIPLLVYLKSICYHYFSHLAAVYATRSVVVSVSQRLCSEWCCHGHLTLCHMTESFPSAHPVIQVLNYLT